MNAELKISQTERLKLYSFERFDDGSGFTAVIDIVSGYFSCIGKQIYFDNLDEFHEGIIKGYETLSGGASLKYRYEEDGIEFQFSSFGHVYVSGVFNDYTEKTQRLEICFKTDQSFLPPFIKEIGEVLEKI